MSKAQVGIIMGSDSDLAIMKDAVNVLKEFGIGCEVVIASAHRAPARVHEFAAGAEARGLQVIIAGAGMAAHLPGVVAAFTPLPVIGVPMYNAALSGEDALYAIVQMPSGIPVATVGLNNAKNAGILAAQMLSIQSKDLREKLKSYKNQLAEEVAAKDAKLQKLGIEGYLEPKNKK